MKITGIKTYWLKVPYDKPFEPTWYPGKRETHQHILLVRVMTDEGIEGYGSGEFPFGLTPTYMTFIQDMIAPWLIGQDPLMIEKLATRLKGDGRLAPRPWIVENALWDILGKKAGLPTYKVMGGYRDHIPAYAAHVRVAQRRGTAGGRAPPVRRGLPRREAAPVHADDKGRYPHRGEYP